MAPTRTIDRIDAGWPRADAGRVASPRAMAWVLLVASAAAILLVGVIATVLVLGNFAGSWRPAGAAFWAKLLVASVLTVVSLTIRSLRWIFLLRRTGTRIPIRDAYIGYFAGLSLLLTPFLLGEIAVRAAVHRTRAGVPVATTIVVNLWDRLLDLVALALIAGSLGFGVNRSSPVLSAALLAAAVVPILPAARRLCLQGALWIARPVARLVDRQRAGDVGRLAATRTWVAALGASVAAWLLPGIALWAVAGAGDRSLSLLTAEHAYAWSASLGGLVLAPGGIIVTGRSMIEALVAAGFPLSTAAITVFGTRLATAGVATALGTLFLLVHLRTRHGAADASHFDTIADIYDEQIPESRRTALLARKTALIRDTLLGANAGRVGLDVGCGQGEHLRRMRELGFDVSGIDASPAQLELAARKLGSTQLVRLGSVLEIPAPDASYDFAYIINVLHHLGSVDEQRRAIAELLRVLKPGGLLIIHEMNTRSILFRFYLGYIYPSLNCIDEGVERWLLPHRLDTYTSAPVEHVRYFTFLPDFIPAALVRLLTPLERLLEASPLRVYSAHYVAVLRNSASGRRLPTSAHERI
jgi:ubiquinone/menaquinone biosynthesis C-methylase UbiE/uncharacterized membrane protein YbhN (UPF0104 family)